MEEVLKLYAEELANKKKKVIFKHNSVFSAMNLAPNSETESSISSKIASIISNELTELKTKLIPVVKMYKNIVNEKLVEYSNDSKLNKFKVTVQEMPDLVEMLVNKGKIMPTEIAATLPLATMVITPPENIKEYVTYNSPVLDNELAMLTVNMSDNDIINIWSKYLENISENNINMSNLNNVTFNNLSEVLVLLAIAINLKTNKPKGVRVSDGTYMQVIDLLTQKISHGINSLVDRYQVYEKFDRIILDSSEYELIVHEPQYNELMKTTSVEALLGRLISGNVDKTLTVNDIAITADKYIAKWEHHVKMEKFKEISREPLKYKTVYNLSLVTLLNNIPEDVAEQVTLDIRDIDTNLNILFRDMHPDHLSVVDNMAKDIIGMLVFADSKLSEYLEYMYTYHRDDKKLTTEELYTLASIDMIFNYLSQQFVIADA